MPIDHDALKKYSKSFHVRFRMVEDEYNTPYEWPEMDTLRYEICGCISFGLNQAAITLTNHLLESLLKYSLSYHHSLNNEITKSSEFEMVDLLMIYTEEGLRKYSKETLSSNIKEARRLGLINEDEFKILNLFREKFRNSYGHSDKEKIFGDLSFPVVGAELHDSEIVSRPPVEVDVSRMPILHGLIQAQIAETEAPEYFKRMDSLVRKMKRRVFPDSEL